MKQLYFKNGVFAVFKIIEEHSMAEQSRRQKLKKNELEDLVIRAVEWIKSNRSTFYTGVGIAADILIFGIFFITRYHSLSVRGEERLTLAQAQTYQGQADQALASLDAITVQYSGTLAIRARLMKADILSGLKRYKDAEETLRTAIEKRKPESMIPLAVAALGNVQETAEDYASAAKTYADFTARFPDHYLAPRVYESLARAYALSGNTVDAKNINEKIVTLFPTSPWAQRAQERMSTMAPSVNK